MPTITIHAGEWAARYLGALPCTVEVADGCVLETALVGAGLPADEIGFISLDGALVAGDIAVERDIEIKILPSIIGG